MSSQNLPSIGELIGSYRILKRLGQGGMGAVFLGQTGKELYALKALLETNSTVLDRFSREIDSLKRLSNYPNILPIHEVLRWNGKPILVCAYIDGCTLTDMIEDQAFEGWEECALMVRDLAHALSHVHRETIIHRDLKPANILICKSGQAFIADFGLAGGDDFQTLTRSNELLGTPSYMSPEQINGDHKSVGPPSDIWSLGVIFFQMVSGALPFQAPSGYELMSQILFSDPFESEPIPKETPRPLIELIKHCLAKNPSERPNANELALDLDLIAAGASPTFSPRSPRKFWLGFILLIVVIGLIVLLSGRLNRPKERQSSKLSAKQARSYLHKNEVRLWNLLAWRVLAKNWPQQLASKQPVELAPDLAKLEFLTKNSESHSDESVRWWLSTIKTGIPAVANDGKITKSQALFTDALGLIEAGQLKEARQKLETMAIRSESESAARAYLVVSYAQEKDWKRAYQNIDESCFTPPLRSEIRRIKGLLHIEQSLILVQRASRAASLFRELNASRLNNSAEIERVYWWDWNKQCNATVRRLFTDDKSKLINLLESIAELRFEFEAMKFPRFSSREYLELARFARKQRSYPVSAAAFAWAWELDKSVEIPDEMLLHKLILNRGDLSTDEKLEFLVRLLRLGFCFTAETYTTWIVQFDRHSITKEHEQRFSHDLSFRYLRAITRLKSSSASVPVADLESIVDSNVVADVLRGEASLRLYEFYVDRILKVSSAKERLRLQGKIDQAWKDSQRYGFLTPIREFYIRRCEVNRQPEKYQHYFQKALESPMQLGEHRFKKGSRFVMLGRGKNIMTILFAKHLFKYALEKQDIELAHKARNLVPITYFADQFGFDVILYAVTDPKSMEKFADDRFVDIPQSEKDSNLSRLIGLAKRVEHTLTRKQKAAINKLIKRHSQ